MFSAKTSNQRHSASAATAPLICAMINSGPPVERMPANVLEKQRATVTAGFANDVDAVIHIFHDLSLSMPVLFSSVKVNGPLIIISDK